MYCQEWKIYRESSFLWVFIISVENSKIYDSSWKCYILLIPLLFDICCYISAMTISWLIYPFYPNVPLSHFMIWSVINVILWMHIIKATARWVEMILYLGALRGGKWKLCMHIVLCGMYSVASLASMVKLQCSNSSSTLGWLEVLPYKQILV